MVGDSPVVGCAAMQGSGGSGKNKEAGASFQLGGGLARSLREPQAEA
jgi:hypothetical protein